jgi:uncharacterized protein YneF (UPF0154 family)
LIPRWALNRSDRARPLAPTTIVAIGVLVVMLIGVALVMYMHKKQTAADGKGMRQQPPATGNAVQEQDMGPAVEQNDAPGASSDLPDLDWDHQSGRGGQRDDGVDRSVLLV